jgi:eukaryotic-like serine/threonine-protein kinase
MADTDPLIGRALGHYRIAEKIGAGGMGEVYRAHDEHLDREVAIKVLRRGTLADDSSRRHFRKEALALSKLNHPNIATIHDFDTQKDLDFLVMEYIDGVTLSEKLKKGSVPEKEVIALGAQLAEGLSAAHEHGVVHRDLKPGNLRQSNGGRLKILDFGLAKLRASAVANTASETLSETQTMAGTVPYMAPEQVLCGEIDARTDIHAAGAVLYEMATGRRPFIEVNRSDLIGAILRSSPRLPSTFNSGLSPELSRIIGKCLEKEPENRYQSAKEFAIDLRRLQSGVLSAVQPTTADAPRWSAKATGLGLLVFAFVIVALLAFNVGNVRRRLLSRADAPRIASLAVLPLANLSGDPQEEYFADGMTEELITNLGRVHSLRVISRTSAMQYKQAKKALPEIAKELNVDAVVEGSVLRSGNRVRITAQLIQAKSDRRLWGDSYERDANDILALQGEVAQAIAGQIQVELTPQEHLLIASARPINPAAQEAYLRGLYYWNKRTPEGLKKALQYFQQAIDRDPNSALAYAGLSYTYAFSPELSLPSEIAKEKQKAAALKSVELDDSLPEAHTSLGGALEDDWDWRGAEQEYKRAIELNPNYATARHWYSVLLSVLRRSDDAIAEARRALELDPLSLIIQANLGERYLNARRYDEAIQECQKALEMDSSFVLAHDCLGFAHLQKGRFDAAIAEFKTAAGLSHGDPQSISALGYAYAISGKTDAAASILKQLTGPPESTYHPAYYIAIVEAGLGKKDDAFEWLERAYRNRSAELPDAKIEPMLDNLRSDSRLSDLIRRMGLPL